MPKISVEAADMVKVIDQWLIKINPNALTYGAQLVLGKCAVCDCSGEITGHPVGLPFGSCSPQNNNMHILEHTQTCQVGMLLDEKGKFK
jgi:hypothetical protein